MGSIKSVASPELVSGEFKRQNGDLYRLPQDVLCDEAKIKELIAQIEESDLPFSEKIRLIHERDLKPFVDGSRLSGEFRLLLEVSDNLDALNIYRIASHISAEQLNGKLDTAALEKELLVSVPNPRLLFSARALSECAVGDSERELAAQLYTLGKRITTYRGVPVTWDQAVDNKVWTTNIDTVHFINQLAGDGVLARTDVESAMELGVGGGAISKTLIANLPALKEYTATDISPYALMCAKRNIAPILKPGTEFNLYLGKGLKTIEAAVDLLVVNPPYIPHLQRPDAVDPYRGTGLIKEVLEIGVSRLNPNNPKAAIYLGMSSLADKDFAEYLAQNPGIKVERIGDPLEVPLKIAKVNENKEWLEFLKREHGLVDSDPRARESGFRFWHSIYVLKITRGDA